MDKGPYSGIDSRHLGILESALIQDQGAAAAKYGAEDTWNLAREIGRKRFAVQAAAVQNLGRDLDKGIVPQLQQAIVDMSQGKGGDFRRLVSNLPDDMVQPAVATAMNKAFTTFAKSPGQSLGVPGFVKWYGGLSRNKSNMQALSRAIGYPATRRLRNIYEVASGMQRAGSEKVYSSSQIDRMMNQFAGEKGMLGRISANEGKLKIGDAELDVAVLENGRRIISQSSVFKAFGRPQRGGRAPQEEGVINMPAFMDAANLKKYINQDVMDVINKVKYKTITGSVQEGYDASIIPLVCDVYLKAREAGAITRPNQLETAKKAEILVRSLAKVGIIALVDEATGYQRDREKDALAKILEAFVAKEIQPYITTFPADYYEELFRLRGLEYPPENPRFRPQYFGVLTNDIVYKRLAPNILEELKKQNVKASKGTKLFQGLTPNIGYQKLREHLSSTVTIMKLSNDYSDFIAKMNRLHPRFEDVKTDELDDSDK